MPYTRVLIQNKFSIMVKPCLNFIYIRQWWQNLVLKMAMKLSWDNECKKSVYFNAWGTISIREALLTHSSLKLRISHLASVYLSPLIHVILKTITSSDLLEDIHETNSVNMVKNLLLSPKDSYLFVGGNYTFLWVFAVSTSFPKQLHILTNQPHLPQNHRTTQSIRECYRNLLGREVWGCWVFTSLRTGDNSGFFSTVIWLDHFKTQT